MACFACSVLTAKLFTFAGWAFVLSAAATCVLLCARSNNVILISGLMKIWSWNLEGATRKTQANERIKVLHEEAAMKHASGLHFVKAAHAEHHRESPYDPATPPRRSPQYPKRWGGHRGTHPFGIRMEKFWKSLTYRPPR